MTDETKEMLQGWIDDLNGGTYPDEAMKIKDQKEFEGFIDGMIFALEQAIASSFPVKA